MEHYKNLSTEDIDGEIWKDIEQFEGMYQVSNLARVKSISRMVNSGLGSIRRVNERIIKQSFDLDGYLFVVLSRYPSRSTFGVHRLLARHFIPNPENKATVNHKNGVKTNNCIENLEWATVVENNAHARRSGLTIAARGESAASKLKDEDVLLIRKLYANGVKQDNLSDTFKVTQSCISQIVNEKYWKHLL